MIKKIFLQLSVNRSLRNRLLIYFLLISLIPFSAASFTAYRTIYHGARQGVIREMKSLAEATAETVNVYMNERVSDLMLWSKLRGIREGLELVEMREDATDVLRNFVKDYPAYLAVLVLDEQGKCAISSWHGFRGKSFAKAPLFTHAFKGETYVQDMHRDERLVQTDPDNDGWTMGFSVPIQSGGSTIGVVCAFLKWSMIEQILSRAHVGSTGYAYMVNRNFQLIAHPTRELYLEAVAGPRVALPDLAKAMKAKDQYFEYFFKNAKTGKVDDKIVGLAYPGACGNFQGLGWIFGAGAHSGELMGFLTRLMKYLALMGAGVILVVILVSFYLAGGIARPVTAVAHQVNRVSGGDLTVDIPQVKRQDELGSLTRAFGGLIQNLKAQVRETLEGVNVLTRSADEISGTVSQLTVNATQSSDAVLKTTKIVQQVKEATQLSAEKVSSVSGQASAIAESGKRATEETVVKMTLIHENMDYIKESVMRLQDHSRAIEEIVGAVHDIAAQSNLLAVNASIEAASAGEHGKGFTVVAHEIKSLADQSKESTGRVRNILGEIRQSIGAVVDATESASRAVEDGVEHSKAAGQSIQSLAASVVASTDSVTLIQSSSGRQVSGLEEIATSINDVEEAVRENAANALQLESLAIRLNELGSQLSRLVTRYRIQ